MRKFHLFVIGVSLVMFVVSFVLAQNDVQVARECYIPNMAMTKIC